MIVFIVFFIVCYGLACYDQTKDVPVDKPIMNLREDMEFADLVSEYIRGDAV